MTHVRGRLEGRVGVLGDVHAEHETLAAFVGLFAAQACGTSLCVGDIADGRGDLDATVRLLRDAGVICVLGNHDRWALADQFRDLDGAGPLSPSARAFLDPLPATRRFESPLGGVMLCHGIGDDDMAELRPDTEGYALEVLDPLHALAARSDVDLMIGGHTHQAMVRAFAGLTVINAGTLRQRATRLPGCLIVDFSDRAVERWVLDGSPRLDQIWRLEPAGSGP